MKNYVEKSVKKWWIRNVNKLQMWKENRPLTRQNVRNWTFTRILQKLFTWLIHDKMIHITSVKKGLLNSLHRVLL